MGYRGKLAEQQQARRLRRTGLPLAEIAATLGVSRSSVSLWVRDVEFTPLPRPPRGRRRAPNALQRRKQAEVDRLVEEGRSRVGRLSEREFLVAGIALYAGEGAKRDGAVKFANSDPRMIAFYCAWLRRFFDLGASVAYWSALTGIPPSQFRKPYRAVPDPTIRHTKHVHGCVSIDYSCSPTHRRIMGFVRALLGDDAIPG